MIILRDKIYLYKDTNNGELILKDYNNIKKGSLIFYVNNNICNDINRN